MLISFPGQDVNRVFQYRKPFLVDRFSSTLNSVSSNLDFTLERGALIGMYVQGNGQFFAQPETLNALRKLIFGMKTEPALFNRSDLWKYPYPVLALNSLTGWPTVGAKQTAFDSYPWIRNQKVRDIMKGSTLDHATGLVKTVISDGANLHLIFNPIVHAVLERNCPTKRNCIYNPNFPKFAALREKWAENQFSFANMLDYMPREPDPKIIRKWYVPVDGTFSDRGGAVYAGAVHKYLRSVLTPK